MDPHPVRQQVVVTDVNMPFGSMVRFMVKWALAAIPAFLILFAVGFLCAVLAGVLVMSWSPFFGSKATAAEPASSTPEPAKATPLTTRPSPSPSVKPFEIGVVRFEAVERNAIWTKFAYQVEIKNLTDDVQIYDVTIEFLDSSGFVLDDAREPRVTVGPRETRTVSSYDMVNADPAARVANVNAKVKLK